MKQCYFCQREVELVAGPYMCSFCWSLEVKVYMGFDKEDPVYAHLCVGKYCVILHLTKNETVIFHNKNDHKDSDGFGHILTLPGFPINPQNVMTKLPLYLLLS